ncbi:MAG: hypothetical protein GY821_07640 [Gammaproteobacteria bacterium]|nr:hypothetical protein [Gammaproteobacteria bacterium]
MENRSTQPLYLILLDSKQWPIKNFQASFTNWTDNTLERGGNEAASNHILKMPSDLIIIDIDLNDQSSLNLCGSLRAKGITTPILALVSHGRRLRSEIIELTCHQAGITDWQYWPLNEKQWMEWLKLWLPEREISIHYIKRLG